jgi:hypothetical protein
LQKVIKIILSWFSGTAQNRRRNSHIIQYIICHFHTPKHMLIRHFSVSYIGHFWALAQLEEVEYSTYLRGGENARQSKLPQTCYVSQTWNTNILQLIGGCGVHNQQKQAGKNGMVKCVFLLKNIIIFFIILTIILISKCFHECYSKPKDILKLCKPNITSVTDPTKWNNLRIFQHRSSRALKSFGQKMRAAHRRFYRTLRNSS